MDKSKKEDKTGKFQGYEVASKKPTHRYFCDACTNIAFYHVEGEKLPNSAVCKQCGKTLTNLKEENLIQL